MKKIHYLKSLLKQRFWLLLITLILQIVLPVVLYQNTLALKSLRAFVFTLFLLACVNFIRQFRALLQGIVFLAIGALLLHWVQVQYADSKLDIAGTAFSALFLIGVFVNLMKQLFRIPEVDEDAIAGVASGYLLLGFIFAILNHLIFILYPHAFNISGSGENVLVDLTYYSFTTLITIGYGDILPQLSASRMLSILFGIFGQFYVAIVIALMIAKYIYTMQIKKENQDKESQ